MEWFGQSWGVVTRSVWRHLLVGLGSGSSLLSPVKNVSVCFLTLHDALIDVLVNNTLNSIETHAQDIHSRAV